MTFRVVSLSWILCAALAAPVSSAPAMPSSPPAGVMATVNGVIGAVNANDPVRVNSYFAIRSTIIDEVPPYVWSGTAAGAAWWRTVQSVLAQQHGSALHVTMQRIASWNMSSSGAYVVLDLRIANTIHGRPHHEDGLWALTMKRLGGTWVVTTAAWATLPQS